MAGRKFRTGDRVLANDYAPGDYENRQGVVLGYVRPGQYLVQFEPRGDEAGEGVLDAGWLDQLTPATPSVRR